MCPEESAGVLWAQGFGLAFLFSKSALRKLSHADCVRLPWDEGTALGDFPDCTMLHELA